MMLKVSYFENKISFEDNHLNVIEIENKKYFYRFVNDLYNLDKEINDNLVFYEENKEINKNNKVKVYIDYFNLELNSKKTIADIQKHISNTLSPEEKVSLQKEYSKVINTFKKIVNNIDLSLSIDDEINIETLFKILKLSINNKTELLDNLLLLMDIENTFKTDNILIFINLKQYMSKSELIELYKYAIYNNIQIMLIDSQSYGGTLDYEHKLIIDENLDEFML